MKNGALRSVAVLLPVLLSTSCTVGPDYKRPEMAHPPEFRSQIQPADARSLADLPWWQVFNDPALRKLITDGLNNSYDIAVAVARIDQARALVGVSESESSIQVTYEGFAAGEKTFVPEEDSVGTVSYGSVGAVLRAAWELDLWGRIRRSNEAARANLLAQQEARRGVMLTLVSDMAAGYFRLLRLDRELAIAQESTRTYGGTLNLFTRRFEAGRDSRLPVERTQAAYHSSASRIADLKREITQQENALSILAGGYPRAIERGLPLTAQVLPQTPVGLTTALLQRRPDIRQAEQEMIRANAEVGVAVANFYPRIGLSALAGIIGVDGEGGIEGDFDFWRAGAAVTGPIFTGGRLEELYNARRGFWDETIARYKRTVLVAFQETSNALVAQQTLVDRRAALEAQVRSLRQSIDLATTRYGGGRASYFEVLEAQQQLFPAEDALAETQQNQLVAVVNLYKALGGGWNLKDAEWAQPR